MNEPTTRRLTALFNDRAERGKARGVNAVESIARSRAAAGSAPGLANAGRSGRVLVGLAFVATVVAGGAALSSRVGTSNSATLEVSSAGASEPLTTSTTAWLTGPCAAPRQRDHREQTDTERQDLIARTEALRAEEQRTGWARYQDKSSTGQYYCGWIRIGQNATSAMMDARGGAPMYDGIDGNVIGYSFAYLGFLERTTVESDDFDPVSLRTQRFGCDPIETACKQSIGEGTGDGSR